MTAATAASRADRIQYLNGLDRLAKLLVYYFDQLPLPASGRDGGS